MNHHLEHHMFPLVPFHALPALSQEVKDQVPEPDVGLLKTNWRVMLAAVQRAIGRHRAVSPGAA